MKHEWVIKNGSFEAHIEMSQVGDLPIPKARKLLRMSFGADNPESFSTFGRHINAVIAEEDERLLEMRELVKEQKRRVANLKKMKEFYGKFKEE